MTRKHLILTRRAGESIEVSPAGSGEHVLICVERVQGKRVRLGIYAAHTTRVLRAELKDPARLLGGLRA